jgi:hypothetical protein
MALVNFRRLFKIKPLRVKQFKKTLQTSSIQFNSLISPCSNYQHNFLFARRAHVRSAAGFIKKITLMNVAERESEKIAFAQLTKFPIIFN